MNKTADATCSNIYDAIASVDRAYQFISSNAESHSDQELAEDLFQASTYLTSLLSELGTVTTALRSLAMVARMLDTSQHSRGHLPETIKSAREIVDHIRGCLGSLSGLRAAELVHQTEATGDERAAVARLLRIAQGDSGQCKRVADFLLAWWNPTTCGRFDLTDTWALDRNIRDDVVMIFGMVARLGSWPNETFPELADNFRSLVAEWRPRLAAPKRQHRS
ncbi:DUF7673 family protein [Xanthomonas perforans]|uniref:DUF7673 family protein n=3 Tax=Xanthomonas TaxID=338 RepID=UPI00069A7F82|nr:hypothetical protein [Xanthomonas perforans]